MKRSNYIIGLTASIALHGALLWTMVGRAAAPAPPPPPPAPVAPVQIASLDPHAPEEAPDPATKAATEPVEARIPEPPAPPAPPPEPEPEVIAKAPPPPPVESTAHRRGPAIVEPVAPPAEATPPPPVTPAPLPRTEPEMARALDLVPETPAAPRLVPTQLTPPDAIGSVTAPAPEPAPPARRLEPDPPRWAAVSDPSLPSAPPPPPAGAAALADLSTGLPGAENGADDGLPPLRIHWKDANELLAVARAWGLRLGAVDAQRRVVAEVVPGRPATLAAWTELSAGYSSRVRVLSPSIFPASLGRDRGVDVREVWVFVPAAQDRTMIAIQREALRRAGMQPGQVHSMDGRFVAIGGGAYRLEVTHVRRR